MYNCIFGFEILGAPKQDYFGKETENRVKKNYQETVPSLFFT